MIRRRGLRALFLTGFLLSVSPLAYHQIAERKQRDQIWEYQTAADRSWEETAARLNAARAYNRQLMQTEAAGINPRTGEKLRVDSYQEQLDLTGNGMMGSLEIPKIDAGLPIWHGTGEEALAQGVGHLQGTSLPVGGENTHCVLAGHRGLPGAKLLTRLDELEEGDCFFLRVCGQSLAYKVCAVTVVRPEDASLLAVQEGCDLVSIVTCTPYGLNTHRLIVTGERTGYEGAGSSAVQKAVPSGRELVLCITPFFLSALAAGLWAAQQWREGKSPKRGRDREPPSEQERKEKGEKFTRDEQI